MFANARNAGVGVRLRKANGFCGGADIDNSSGTVSSAGTGSAPFTFNKATKRLAFDANRATVTKGVAMDIPTAKRYALIVSLGGPRR